MQAPELLGGRYEVRGLLGRGGMAEVRDGWDRRLQRPVAVKLLHPMWCAQEDLRRRFEVEARAAAGLNHPHIVAVHDSGEHDGTPYIVMERLSGWTLADAVARGPLPQPQVRSILDDVLSALAAAHGAGILHRDIKPANILFTPTGDAKVGDFGIAKGAGGGHTLTGQVFGTVAYLSADRVAGRPATPADDIYAVGVVGWEALTGRRLYPQENLAELARAIVEQPAPSVALARPDVDPALATAIDRATVRDRAGRFPDAPTMRAALAGGQRPATRILTDPLPPRRRARRAIGLAAALAAVLLAAAAFIADATTRGPSPATHSTSTPVPAPPPPPSSSSIAPPPSPATLAPVPVEQPRPHKGGSNGNGNGKKPKGD